ncbi:hypothetical protein TRAPUB_2502 [Trametes pubescens]|uniref:Uncharacterized protein n=1 Tax=Trametes pubescens TaxID=154538 RepID=A0A1M2VGA8_TRAPU|nr:hypothetical protein TRAPUB_2502 [Trametes pubescens]
MQFTLNLFLFLSVFTLAVNAVPVVDGFHAREVDGCPNQDIEGGSPDTCF